MIRLKVSKGEARMLPDAELGDLEQKAAIAQKMLDRVVLTTNILDEKVGRTLTSVSFLTVAATILFGTFVNNRLLYSAGGTNIVPLLFLGYVIWTSVATAFMLKAMGPWFHFAPLGLPAGAVTKHSRPVPTGYAEIIATTDRTQWIEHFKDLNLLDFTEGLYSESVAEIHDASVRVSRKVKEIRRAQESILIAVLFLVSMTALGITNIL